MPKGILQILHLSCQSTANLLSRALYVNTFSTWGYSCISEPLLSSDNEEDNSELSVVYSAAAVPEASLRTKIHLRYRTKAFRSMKILE